MSEDRCVMCGRIIPEGRMICPLCEKGEPEMKYKKKYVLMQAPRKDENDYSPQIMIIDNSRPIGKEKVESLCNQGWNAVGCIESDLLPGALRGGICREESDKLNTFHNMFNQISDLADSHLLVY